MGDDAVQKVSVLGEDVTMEYADAGDRDEE